MRLKTLAFITVFAGLVLGAFAMSSAEAATVTGQIDLRGGGNAKAPTPNLYGKYNGPAKSVVAARPGVVALMPVGAKAEYRMVTAPIIDQEDLTFKPHVLPIQRGTKVRFTNSDTFFHNVFSLSQTKSFDLGRYPKGDEEAVVFDKTGVVPIFCDIHSDMKAYVVVVDTPHFTVTDENGGYTISSVPDGTYDVWVWREGQGKLYREDSVVVNSYSGPNVPAQ